MMRGSGAQVLDEIIPLHGDTWQEMGTMTKQDKYHPKAAIGKQELKVPSFTS